MSSRDVTKKKYQVDLYYGYQVFEGGDVYHAFEAVDPDKKVSERKMENELAEALDTTRHDDRFNYGSMYIRLPESVVKTIKNDGVREFLDKLLCFECTSKDCAYCKDGICRFSLVHDRKPKMTEDDGCLEGVFGG